MSVYELVEHPDYTYCLGDVVIRLSPGPSSELSTLTEDSEGAASSGVDGTEQGTYSFLFILKWLLE